MLQLSATIGTLADRYDMMDNGHGNGWMFLWGALILILLVAAFGFLAWMMTQSSRSSRAHPHDRAREILAERLATGEITPEEYRERSQHLK